MMGMSEEFAEAVERRADLTGVDKAVSEVLDELLFRMHGLTSSRSDHREFLEWLDERGYVVVEKPVKPWWQS
jgi:hypothetical protein